MRLPDGKQIGLGDRITLLNFPVISTVACPSIGECGDAILADLRYYLIGEYIDDMCDGCPTIQSPKLLKDNHTSISPFVILDSSVQ